MKKVVLLSLLVLWGCQDTNSNSYDKDKYSEVDISDPTFKAAFNVLQTRCINCHYHQGWSKYTESEMWAKNGLVVFGDSDNSPIIYKTINSKSARANMPEGSPTGIPGDEYQKILDWVERL